jgi:hypothetical protein
MVAVGSFSKDSPTHHLTAPHSLHPLVRGSSSTRRSLECPLFNFSMFSDVPSCCLYLLLFPCSPVHLFPFDRSCSTPFPPQFNFCSDPLVTSWHTMMYHAPLHAAPSTAGCSCARLARGCWGNLSFGGGTNELMMGANYFGTITTTDRRLISKG